MAQYHVYFDRGGDFGSLLRSALNDYRARYRMSPRAVVVHPSLKDEAAAALAALGVPAGVEINRGMLVTEVWLPAPEPDGVG